MERLPGELIVQILESFGAEDLCTLRLVNKCLARITTPLLYADCKLDHTEIKSWTARRKIQQLIRTFVEKPHLARLVKRLEVGCLGQEDNRGWRDTYTLNDVLATLVTINTALQSLTTSHPKVGCLLRMCSHGADSARLLSVLASLESLRIHIRPRDPDCIWADDPDSLSDEMRPFRLVKHAVCLLESGGASLVNRLTEVWLTGDDEPFWGKPSWNFEMGGLVF